MKIEIPNQELLYKFVTRVLPAEEMAAQAMAVADTSAPRQLSLVELAHTVPLDCAPLDKPLLHVNGRVIRRGAYFTAHIRLISDVTREGVGVDYQAAESRLEDFFKNRIKPQINIGIQVDIKSLTDIQPELSAIEEFSWRPTSKEMEGYFVRDGANEVSVQNFGRHREERVIAVGGYGAFPRALAPKNFHDSLRKLTEAASVVLNACLPSELAQEDRAIYLSF